MLSVIAITALAAGAVKAQSSALPTFTAVPAQTAVAAGQTFTPPNLTQYRFTWPDVPSQVNPFPVSRGPQFGFNNCSSTGLSATQLQTQNCQTGWLNSVSDFCLWSSPTPNNDVGDFEAEAVAWCTQPTHGARVIPAGAITAVQFIQTPDYVQVTGLINQQYVNIDPNDGGGELDPHGADEQGNPLGSLMFTTGFRSAQGTITQGIEWHNFMGSGAFCFKVCDPTGPNAAELCQHVFDRIGCAYNAPAAYAPGVFESCLGDNQDPPGVYTGANGVVSTFVQPAESLGPIASFPYTARIPATSSCTTYSSAALFSGAPTVSLSSSSSSAMSKSSTKATASASSTSKAAASSSAAAHSGASTAFAMSGVWSVAIGLAGAAVGAVFVL